jgi:hypothetical protein
LKRSAASGDERNRPQRRPRDDDGNTTFPQLHPQKGRQKRQRRHKSSMKASQHSVFFVFFVFFVYTPLRRSSLRAITFAQKLRCALFFRSHPSPLLRSTSPSIVVAAGDYVHEITPLRSVFSLTSIAPTPLVVAIHCRRCACRR